MRNDEANFIQSTGFGLTPERSEEAYRLASGYRFAQKLLEGKAVADIHLEEVGYGARLLARSASSVVSLTASPGAVSTARMAHALPNMRFEVSVLPDLPLASRSLDAIVAFEVLEKLEWPGDLVAEARRVLKEDGLFLVSTPDKQAFYNDRNERKSNRTRPLYAAEFKEMLERHFDTVTLYRAGAVAGGMVLGVESGPSDLEIESTRFTLSEPPFDRSLPSADIILAVCGTHKHNVQPLLLLDRDRRLLHECEDGHEDVEQLKEEILHMQETEVQAFKDVLNVRESELVHLRSRLERTEGDLARSEAQAKRLEDRLRLLENSRGWRALETLRGLSSVSSRLRRSS